MEHQFEIFYDSSCPFCQRCAEWIKKRDIKNQIYLSDINNEVYILELLGINLDAAYGEVHAIWAYGGNIIKGPMVARAVLRLLGYKIIHRLIRLPLIAPLFDAGFNWISRNRHRILL